MNRNHKIKALAAILATGTLITATPIMSQASPLAGAVAKIYEVESASANILTPDSALSGTNLVLSNYLASTLKGTLKGDAAAAAPQEEPAVIELPEEEGEFAHYGIIQVESYLNIRSEPSEEAEVIGKIYNNCGAYIADTVGDWLHIMSGNCNGYVKSDYVVVNNPELCIAHSRLVCRVEADALNVRADMSTDSEVIASFDKGAGILLADAISEDSPWLKVAIGESEGYVAREFVRIVREYNGIAETRAEEEARIQRQIAEAAAMYAANNGGGNGGGSRSGGGSSYSGGGSSRSYNPPSGGSGASVADFALQFVGNPYVWGGTSLTNGADCSGFTLAVYQQFGVSLPHSSYSQAYNGYHVDRSQMQAGDLVCYGGHVGIAINDSQIVHASNSRDGIKVSNAFYRDVVDIRRIF